VKPNSVQENSLYANDIRSSVLDGEYYSMRMRARRLFAGRSFRTLVAVYGVLVILLVSSLLLSQSADPWTLVKTVVGLATFTAIVAFGQYLVVLTGGLDLSIPSVMTLAGVMLTGISHCLDYWWSCWSCKRTRYSVSSDRTRGDDARR
jgi:ABC-type xylose transport system permease subunit